MPSIQEVTLTRAEVGEGTTKDHHSPASPGDRAVPVSLCDCINHEEMLTLTQSPTYIINTHLGTVRADLRNNPQPLFPKVTLQRARVSDCKGASTYTT